MGLSAEQLRQGLDALSLIEPRFGSAIAAVGYPEPRVRPRGYETLLRTIVGQQVSFKAADAVWAKLAAALGEIAVPDKLLAKSEDELRACGLSRQKIRYATALAHAGVDFAAFEHVGDDHVIAALVALPGIGRWTAEVYAMFSLGRADVFAPGDLALQESARLLFDLPDRPTEKALRRMAEDWSPWRSVAARALWAYYRVAKGREGIS